MESRLEQFSKLSLDKDTQVFSEDNEVRIIKASEDFERDSIHSEYLFKPLVDPVTLEKITEAVVTPYNYQIYSFDTLKKMDYVDPLSKVKIDKNDIYYPITVNSIESYLALIDNVRLIRKYLKNSTYPICIFLLRFYDVESNTYLPSSFGCTEYIEITSSDGFRDFAGHRFFKCTFKNIEVRVRKSLQYYQCTFINCIITIASCCEAHIIECTFIDVTIDSVESNHGHLIVFYKNTCNKPVIFLNKFEKYDKPEEIEREMNKRFFNLPLTFPTKTSVNEECNVN